MVDDDHAAAPIRTPVRPAPVRPVAPWTPRVVVVRRRDVRALGPEIKRIGRDARIRVVELADLAFLAAVDAADDRDIPALLELFGIVEAVAAREKTSEARIVRDRPRHRIELAPEDFEAGVARLRIDVDDLAAPAHRL